MNLTTSARHRQLPLIHPFVFRHGFCPECVAHYEERMAAYRGTTAWGLLERISAPPPCRSR